MSSRTVSRFALAMMAAATLVACADAPPAPAQPEAVDLRRDRLPEDVVSKLEALRASLEPYRSFEAAQVAGYDIEVTPCMVMRPHGGMGYHYGKGSIIDGTPDETAPEVLLFEPTPHGGKVLVGVEFIVPFDKWQGTDAPMLFGRPMARNETFQVWALHAWLFKHNPQGVFADWNPRVNC